MSSPFSTKNVVDMSRMFSECTQLDNIDLLSFDTKNVNKMDYMFFG